MLYDAQAHSKQTEADNAVLLDAFRQYIVEHDCLQWQGGELVRCEGCSDCYQVRTLFAADHSGAYLLARLKALESVAAATSALCAAFPDVIREHSEGPPPHDYLAPGGAMVDSRSVLALREALAKVEEFSNGH